MLHLALKCGIIAIEITMGGLIMGKETDFTAKQVGERIKERRLELHASMEQLAQALGVNKSPYNEWSFEELSRRKITS